MKWYILRHDPELDIENRYLQHLHPLPEQKARKGYAVIATALAVYKQANERSKWGFCLKAACNVIGLDYRAVITWFNEMSAQPDFLPSTPEQPTNAQMSLLN